MARRKRTESVEIDFTFDSCRNSTVKTPRLINFVDHEMDVDQQLPTDYALSEINELLNAGMRFREIEVDEPTESAPPAESSVGLSDAKTIDDDFGVLEQCHQTNILFQTLDNIDERLLNEFFPGASNSQFYNELKFPFTEDDNADVFKEDKDCASQSDIEYFISDMQKRFSFRAPKIVPELDEERIFPPFPCETLIDPGLEHFGELEIDDDKPEYLYIQFVDESITSFSAKIATQDDGGVDRCSANFYRIINEHLRKIKKPQDAYLSPACEQDHYFTIALHWVLHRYIQNEYDKLANVLLKKMIKSSSETFFHHVVRVMFVAPALSLNHAEVMALGRYVTKHNITISIMHLLIAIDGFREQNFVLMERELKEYYFCLRYLEQSSNFKPIFQDDDDQAANPDNPFIILRSFEATIYTAYMLILHRRSLHGYKLLNRSGVIHSVHKSGNLSHIAQLMKAFAHLLHYDITWQEPQPFSKMWSDFANADSYINMNEEDLDSLVDEFNNMSNSNDADKEGCLWKFMLLRVFVFQYCTLSGVFKNSRRLLSLYKESMQLMKEMLFEPIDSLLKTTMRSYNLACGSCVRRSVSKNEGSPPMIDIYSSRQYPEQAAVERVLDCYEMAYEGNFEAALALAEQLCRDFKDSIGFYAPETAYCCIKFDKSFCQDDRVGCQDALRQLNGVCAVEAILREVPFRIRFSKIDTDLLRQVDWLMSHISAVELSSIYNMRVRLVFASIMMHFRRITEAVEVLSKVRWIAKKASMPLFVNIANRRLAVAYMAMDKPKRAYEKISKVQVNDGRYNMPAMELGLTSLTKYLIAKDLDTDEVEENTESVVSSIRPQKTKPLLAFNADYAPALKEGESSKLYKFATRKKPRAMLPLPVYEKIMLLRRAALHLKSFLYFYRWILMEQLDFLVKHELLELSAAERDRVNEFKPVVFAAFHAEFRIELTSENFVKECSTPLMTRLRTGHSLPLYIV